MSLILMCKDNKIYNIETEKVYNKNLLPGYMQKSATKYSFQYWMSLRYSSETNSIANKLRLKGFQNKNQENIDIETYGLSLSDCYWVKDENNPIKFEEISPYYKQFWKGDNEYIGGAVPTLYTNGYLLKEWVSSGFLYKYGEETKKEVECYRLCRACEISSTKAITMNDGIMVSNITDYNTMLEQADMSGRVNNPTEYDIIDLFGIFGLQMLVIDAIVGNGDRHTGNFGWLRDANTGLYLSMAPLYDFDHALDSQCDIDALIIGILDIVKTNIFYKRECGRIVQIVCQLSTYDVFKRRAEIILKNL